MIWRPSGRPEGAKPIGNPRAGRPNVLEGALNTGSPVEPRPSGAVPGAAGVTRTSTSVKRRRIASWLRVML